MTDLRYVPNTTAIVRNGRMHANVPIARMIAHPPGSHTGHPLIRADWWALELQTQFGSRWEGFPSAPRIDATLRMVVDVAERANLQQWERIGQDALHIDDHTLLELIRSVSERNHHYADTGENIDPETLIPDAELQITQAVRDEWRRFETALRAALISWYTAPENADCPANAEIAADALIGAPNSAYAVFMTLNGEGVGIDDYWAQFSHEQLRSLRKHLERALSSFANCSGSGSLNDAIEAATYR